MKYVFMLLLLQTLSTAREVSRSEIVASVIVLEAGGEGEIGMIAVANVIQNRMVQGRTAYHVVTSPKQFSAYTPFRQNTLTMVLKAEKHPRFKFAKVLAAQLEKRQLKDLTGGATHYHTTAVKPYWIASMDYKKKIGNHLFYHEHKRKSS